MSGKRKASDWQSDLREFLAAPLAALALGSLGKTACIALEVGGEEIFLRERKIYASSKVPPDLHFRCTKGALHHLLALAAEPGASLGSLGIAICEAIWTSDESRKLHFRVESGVFTLWNKGYFSVLKAGGPEVASYLAQKGFFSAKRIWDALAKAKG